MKPLVPCSREERDCRANRDGLCLCLNNTKFKRPCPFYKPLTAVKKNAGVKP